MDDETEDFYWNRTNVKSFNFDDEDKNSIGLSSNRFDRKLFVDDNVSEMSYELPESADIPLQMIISDADLRTVLEEQSLNETPLPKTISVDEELKILRRKAQETYHAAPPPSTVVHKMLLKKPFSIECFRSLSEKESLLDEAIRSGNGDGILTIVLFLVRTLKKKHFNAIMQTRPEAVKHYVNYLSLRYEIVECVDFLTMLGKCNEAIMLQFDTIMKLYKSPDVKKQKLNKIFNEFVAHQTPAVHSFYAIIISNYISLLDWQLAEKIHNHKVGTILDTPVLESLFHASSNFKWSAAGSSSVDPATVGGQSNPYKFAEKYKIAQSQFDWIVLNERSQCQAWCDLDSIFERKSWHTLKTSKTFTINVPLDRVVLQLYSVDAPAAVLNKFLSHIDEPQRRLALARRVNAGKSIVDALVDLKDRNELEKYAESLKTGTEQRFYAENAIKNLKSKWKSDSIKLLKN